jgi:hypothetical protein
MYHTFEVWHIFIKLYFPAIESSELLPYEVSALAQQLVCFFDARLMAQ